VLGRVMAYSLLLISSPPAYAGGKGERGRTIP
jgi:hypothetical protein